MSKTYFIYEKNYVFYRHISSSKECMRNILWPIIWLIRSYVAQRIQFREEWHSGRAAAREGRPHNGAPFANQVASPIGASPCRL
jgi:hypothetical protein